MRELAPFIGDETDVPAGDIGVGPREIGCLFGTYKAITEKHEGVMTGKSPLFSGSYMRTEATGYGAAYFLCHVLEAENKTIDGLRVAISGSGNVSLHLAEKIIAEGVKLSVFQIAMVLLLMKMVLTTMILKKSNP
jgi:glutamate dehydrogenase (NADP+)